MSSTSNSIAGIPLSSTPLVNKAIAYLKANCSEITYHHCMRSWVLGTVIASTMPDETFDPEVLAIGTLLHDLAWDFSAHPEFTTTGVRFEVNGANAARKFLKENAPEWAPEKVQRVWDLIALHTTPSIALHKEAEVKLAAMGIFTELTGPGQIPQGLWEGIKAAHPRDGLRDGVKGFMCSLCQHNPEGTRDNWVGEFGEQFVEGYGSRQNTVGMLSGIQE